MAGAIVTLAAMHEPDRVASLTLVSTTSGGADLPPMSEEFTRYTSAGGPDPSDTAAVVDFIVGLTKVYSGDSPYYDETAMRALADRDVALHRQHRLLPDQPFRHRLQRADSVQRDPRAHPGGAR